MRWLRAFLHPVYRRGTVHAEPYEVRCKVTANPSKLSARDLQAAAAVRRPATRGGCYSYFFFFPPATWAVRSWPSAMFTFTRAFYRFFLFFHRLIRSSIASFYTTMFRRKFDQWLLCRSNESNNLDSRITFDPLHSIVTSEVTSLLDQLRWQLIADHNERPNTPYTIIRRFLSELVGTIALDRNYWEVINLLSISPILFYVNIL